MNNSAIATIIALLLCLQNLHAGTVEPRFSATLSLFYLDGAGGPDEDYFATTVKKDYESLVPRLGFVWSISERLQAGASYTDFGTLKADMVAPQWPPFEGIGLQVISPFKVEEELESLGLGFAYLLDIGKGNLKLGLGAEHLTNRHVGGISKKEKDWSLAVSTSYEYPIADTITLSVEYLQVQPPRKTLHLVGGSITWKF